MTIIDHIKQHAACSPDKIAIEEGDRKTTYIELVEMANNLAFNLQQSGIRKGDRVAFQLKNSPEQCALILAIGICGGVMLPINCNNRAVSVYKKMDFLNIRTFIGKQGNELPPGATRLSLESLMEFHNDGTHDFLNEGVSVDDPYWIIQSSGTTGSPKYFVLSHEMVLDAAQKYHTLCGWHRQVRFYMNLDSAVENSSIIASY